MFLAVGSGAYVAAVFHMVTHAFFKANLFLGSGSVIHGMHDEQDMRRMGALRKVMPITAAAFIVGWLAIAGVPPFAGFWSKDEILAFAYDESPALWVLGLFTALLTAFYMSRQVFLVFFGEARWNDPLPGEDPDEPREEIHPHESPWTMTLPLVVLAVLAAVAGFINLPFTDDSQVFEHWMEPVVEVGEAHLSLSGGEQWLLAGASVVVGLIGIALAWTVYLRKRIKPVEPEVLAHAWYIDETIARAVDGPGEAAFEGTATFDRVVIDGAVNGTGSVVRGLGERLRVVQSGFVRSYALAVALGAVALMIYVVSRISG
jgi:NADH-quinone oxidoreductase subunit L